MYLRLQEDYPLKGEITPFEAYMFMTTNKFIVQHSKISHENFSFVMMTKRMNISLTIFEAGKTDSIISMSI